MILPVLLSQGPGVFRGVSEGVTLLSVPTGDEGPGFCHNASSTPLSALGPLPPLHDPLLLSKGPGIFRAFAGRSQSNTQHALVGLGSAALAAAVASPGAK